MRVVLCAPSFQRKAIFSLMLAAVSCGVCRAQFWSLKKAETVSLKCRLSPVASRSGTSVRLVVKTAGNSIPAEAATTLEERIKTLVMDSKAGDIRVQDQGAADTSIAVTITGYEPKVMQSAQRQVGLEHQDLKTWIGNIDASVHVTDARDRPITAANLKFHLENDFLVSAKEDPSATGKKKSWSDKLANTISAGRSGSTSQVASVLGAGGGTMKALTQSQEKGVRQPTDKEWSDALLEGMAMKIASQIVPVDHEFIAILPSDKEFEPARTLAKDGRWGEVQESAEKMTASKGTTEAGRLYLVGLSYEGLACGHPQEPTRAAEELNKASMYYEQAIKAHDDHELQLADLRVKDSMDHYLEIEHMASAAKANAPATKTAKAESKEDVADNDALISMVNSNVSEPILLNYVQTVENPRFDTSSKGLVALSSAKVPSGVIAAVQKRMSSVSSSSTHSRTAPAQTHRSSTTQPH